MALLSLVVDADFYHTVNVWDVATQRLSPVVSIKEADPHSGIAHRYAWSQDSRALLIYGSGRLAGDYNQPVDLCLVYLPHKDELYRLSSCPEAWQRPESESGRPPNDEIQLTGGRPQLISAVVEKLLEQKRPVDRFDALVRQPLAWHETAAHHAAAANYQVFFP